MVSKKCILIALMSGLSFSTARAQTPITDSLVVTFPNEVQVGSQRLPAGEYTVRQINTASNPRLLEFADDKGTSIQATATAIPALDNNNRNDSSVLLETYGAIQVLRQIWIKGKSYGYEFPVKPDQLTSTKQDQVKLTAQYTPTQDQQPERTTLSAVPPSNEQATPSQQPSTVAPTPSTAESNAQPGRPDVAPPTAQAEPAPVAANPAPQREAAPAPQEATPAMPATSLDWSIMLLAGIGLFGSGALALTLRRNY